MQITVRRLQESDVEQLARIEEASFSMPWSARDFADLLTRSYCCYVVAETEGKVVGCAGFTDSFGEANIDNVVVEESCRGKGVAQRLLEELFALGDTLGVEAYTLEVRVGNAPAIHVYEKCGFVSEGIRPNFYEKPTEDAMIMWRRKKP
jgi:ribosomal-protein-alanine N-acetyltransferase